MVNLNENLAKQQKVTKKQRKKLGVLYKDLDNIMEVASLIKDLKFPFKIRKAISKSIEKIEFKLQKNWNFKQDKNWHTYWFQIPGCTCPYHDNKERLGYGAIISQDCPYHGKSLENH